MSTKKFPIPLSYFSMPLGLFALGLSWRYGARIGLLPTWAAETLLAAAFVLWLMLVIAYIIKIRFFRPEFLQDLQDLVQCCFISSIPITTMLAGLAAQNTVGVGLRRMCRKTDRPHPRNIAERVWEFSAETYCLGGIRQPENRESAQYTVQSRVFSQPCRNRRKTRSYPYLHRF